MNQFQWTRRKFLKSTGLLAGGCVALPQWGLAQDAEGQRVAKRLVVIEQHGGNDGLNFLAPTGDDLYHKVRPFLSIGPTGGHRLDDHYRWHPNLGNLAIRYQEGEVCVVQGIGTKPSSLSHFRSRDVWYMGSHQVSKDAQSWLGRLADSQWGLERSPVTMLNVGRPYSPRALQSAMGRAFNFQEKAKAGGLAMPLEGVGEMKGGASGILGRLNQGSKIAREASQALNAIPEFQAKVDWPDHELAQNLARTAAAISADLPTRVFWVSQPGYDTHAYQGEDHSVLLDQLDTGLHAFVGELQARDLLKDTLIMTMSEFGRRVAENGVRKGAGTDHGVASMQLFLGGSCKPGILGRKPDLENLDEDGNFVHEFDFRQSHASVCRDWFGASLEGVWDERIGTLPIFATPVSEGGGK